LSQVEVGKNYALLITTNSGLWRYKIGDTVEFTSINPFRIIVSGRTKHYINTFGEEVIIDNVEKALETIVDKYDCKIVDYTVAPMFMKSGKKGRHDWIIEFSKKPNDKSNFEKDLDLALMKRAARKLIGTKDFSTFRKSSCRAKSPIKTMKSVKIKSSKDKIEIEFKSQSFLQQQVRSMVGCLKYVGEKKWTFEKFINVMNSKKRALCAPPAPPQGLYLTRVIY